MRIYINTRPVLLQREYITCLIGRVGNHVHIWDCAKLRYTSYAKVLFGYSCFGLLQSHVLSMDAHIWFPVSLYHFLRYGETQLRLTIRIFFHNFYLRQSLPVSSRVTRFCKPSYIDRALSNEGKCNGNLNETNLNGIPIKLGSTETWTRIAGFRVLSANHYTIEP